MYTYDALVIGTGHAGIEAALALSKLGAKTLAVSVSLDNVGYLACNPSIGGTGKGHLVREIDALGGFMGIAADKCATQVRMLNSSKGLAVRSLRAQIDKYRYHDFTKAALETQENLTLRQDEVKEICQNGDGYDVTCGNGLTYKVRAVVIASGVYMDAKIYTGFYAQNKGPACFTRSEGLSDSLKKLGYPLRRFKTGTPARVDGRTVDLSKFEVQYGEAVPYTFSVMTKSKIKNTSVCYLGYTNEHTHEIIKRNIHLAPKYAGTIHGTGARYCPSIEDKVVRFADKPRHAFFLEPEGNGTSELYVQGISTSLPANVQAELYRSIKGFENVEIMRDAYAIEYECIDARTLFPTLMSKLHNGIFFAGQVNGTSGYEEAAAQGLVAGINAALYLSGKQQVVLSRADSYIGVMTDDLVTVGTDEPYRMLTGRAECRLSLRQDNADLRLTQIGKDIGLVTSARYSKFLRKKKDIEAAEQLLSKTIPYATLKPMFDSVGENISGSMTLREVLKRSNITLEHFTDCDDTLSAVTPEAALEVYTRVRYDAYLRRQNAELEEIARLENTPLDPATDYTKIDGLRNEAREKLNAAKPLSIGQASRVSGVTPADVWVLIVRSSALRDGN